MNRETLGAVSWETSPGFIDYEDALRVMESRVSSIASGEASEHIWFLQHPSLYTIGTSGTEADILYPHALPVYHSGRGGQVTYHGPGQRVCYVMLNIKARCLDIRTYVHKLELWTIEALQKISITGWQRDGRVGVWVRPQKKKDSLPESKIAAIGVRVRRGVTFHGFAVNMDVDLSYYDKIVPCGLSQYGVTSCTHLGITASFLTLDLALKETFFHHFSGADSG